jgi:hypothetical protein
VEHEDIPVQTRKDAVLLRKKKTMIDSLPIDVTDSTYPDVKIYS